MAVQRNLSNDRRIAAPRNLAARTSLLGVVLLLASAGLAHAAGVKTQAEINKETFFQAVNLAILIGVLVYFARGPVKAFFAERRSGIQSHLDEAASLLQEAEQRNADLQRKLVDLSTEVEGIKSAATARASDEAARILADAEASAERIRRDASAAVDQELRRAQTELRTEAADLAMQLAATKLQSEVGEADRDRLIDEFITRVEPAATAGGSN